MGLFWVEQTATITNLWCVSPQQTHPQAFVLSCESESPPMAAVPQITRFFSSKIAGWSTVELILIPAKLHGAL